MMQLGLDMDSFQHGGDYGRAGNQRQPRKQQAELPTKIRTTETNEYGRTEPHDDNANGQESTDFFGCFLVPFGIKRQAAFEQDDRDAEADDRS